MNIFITGATGNIGLELIRNLVDINEHTIIAGIRNVEKTAKDSIFSNKNNKIELRQFDFENTSTFETALKNIDVVFLLRPPHISNIKKYFKPFIEKIAELHLTKVVFLSVQGAEKSNIIPHRKIELLLLKNNLEYIFMRPSYFMQNLTTTLYAEIVKNKTITLPSSNAKFNWVDIEDIAKLGAEFCCNFEQYKNNAYIISGNENNSFFDVVKKINCYAETNLKYCSVNPITYFLKKKKENIEFAMIIVMFLLHFLPRVQGEPEIVNSIKKYLNKEPNNLEYFIIKNKLKFI